MERLRQISVFLIVLLLAVITFGTEFVQKSFFSPSLQSEFKYAVYLPEGYSESSLFYPVLYLLHGRGDSFAGWMQTKDLLDSMIAQKRIPAMIVILPDVPYSNGGSYFVNSEYTNPANPGKPVETVLTKELVAHVDTTYRSIQDRKARIIGGYSMGGYGALRYALAYPQVFFASIVLSPAVYFPLPPGDSSTREFGAFGKADKLFVDEIYASKNYPALTESFSRLGINSYMFVAVGDDEWQSPDYTKDLDFEAHVLYKYMQKTKGMNAQLRIMDGGHTLDVWTQGLEDGLLYVSSNLIGPLPQSSVSIQQIEKPQVSIISSQGEDLAGGMATDSEGNLYVAITIEGPVYDQPYWGSKDVLLIKYGPDMKRIWTKHIGTIATERAYDLAVDSERRIFITGYTKGNLDGEHPDNSSDDVFLSCFDSDGNRLWVRQFGDKNAADRGYGISANTGNIFLTGYTKGSLEGSNQGDKDVFVTCFDPQGNQLWLRQFGGAGEEKGQAVIDKDGKVWVTGLTASDLAGQIGGYDFFLFAFDDKGNKVLGKQYGTPKNDEGYGIEIVGQNVLITGLTAGDFAATQKGDKDIIVAEFDSNGVLLWKDQIGTDMNDKGAKIKKTPNGFAVAAITDGNLAGASGKFDVALLVYDQNKIPSLFQFGTIENDGADDWAEANLFLSTNTKGVLLSGLSMGSFTGEALWGYTEVFILSVVLEK